MVCVDTLAPGRNGKTQRFTDAGAAGSVLHDLEIIRARRQLHREADTEAAVGCRERLSDDVIVEYETHRPAAAPSSACPRPRRPAPVLGRVYTNLGLFDQATSLLERSLAQRRSLYGSTHASVALDMDLLGNALSRQDRYADAEPLLRAALEQRSEYAAAEPVHREALAIRQRVFGDSALEVADGLNNLGLVLYRRGAHKEAETMYRRALDITLRRRGEDHPSTAKTVQNLAQTLEMLGDLEEAEKLYRRSLAAKRRALGDAHPGIESSSHPPVGRAKQVRHSPTTAGCCRRPDQPPCPTNPRPQFDVL